MLKGMSGLPERKARADQRNACRHPLLGCPCPPGSEVKGKPAMASCPFDRPQIDPRNKEAGHATDVHVLLVGLGSVYDPFHSQLPGQVPFRWSKEELPSPLSAAVVFQPVDQ
jgi:hypothetical protein